MKIILILSSLLFSACSTYSPIMHGHTEKVKAVERNIASDPEVRVYAVTDKIENNGYKGSSCVYFSSIRDGERKAFIKMTFDNGTQHDEEDIYLFDITDSGEPVRKFYYREGADTFWVYLKPNELGHNKEKTDFVASRNTIEVLSQSGISRNGFKLKFKDNDYTKISYFIWEEGVSNLHQLWMAPASMVFGNDYHGNDGYCNFR